MCKFSLFSKWLCSVTKCHVSQQSHLHQSSNSGGYQSPSKRTQTPKIVYKKRYGEGKAKLHSTNNIKCPHIQLSTGICVMYIIHKVSLYKTVTFCCLIFSLSVCTIQNPTFLHAEIVKNCIVTHANQLNVSLLIHPLTGARNSEGILPHERGN